MGYSENKKLQKLCYAFTDWEDEQDSYIGPEWFDVVYEDCYRWQEDLRKNNFKKFLKVSKLYYGEGGMNELAICCRIKKYSIGYEIDIKAMTKEEYEGLFVFVAMDVNYDNLHKSDLTPKNFKILLDNKIHEFINEENVPDVWKKFKENINKAQILNLAYQYRDKPSKFLEVLFKETIDI